MGKQVNFYMLRQDEVEFVEFVLRQTEATIIVSPSLDETPLVLSELPGEAAPPIWRGQVYFGRPGYPVFTRFGIMRAGPWEGRGVYHLDGEQSSVIQYTRCAMLADGKLNQGAIWADMKRLEGQQFVHKGEDFERWYDSLAAWIRRRYRRFGPRPYLYLGPQADAWRQAGGSLHPPSANEEAYRRSSPQE